MTNTVNNVLIDLRFDLPGNPTDLNGNGINSSAQINPLLVHLKSLGFNTVTFDVDVPINMTNGQIDLGSMANGTNKALPADLWKEVAYAKSLGLAVNIQALPCVIYNSDGTINNADTGFSTSTPLANGVSAQAVLKNIATYEASIAKLAQQNGVNGFYVGSNDFGYDTAQYASNWQAIIDAVKAVYSGNIIYQAAYDNAVFGLVDTITYSVDPIISKTPIYNLAQVVEGYYHGISANGSGSINYVQSIQALTQEYHKPVVLGEFQSNSVNPGIGNTVDPWGMLIGSNPASLATLLKPNYAEQSLAYQAYLYVADQLLGNSLAGSGVREYAPWMQSAWIQNPQNTNDQLWNLYAQATDNLWNQPITEAAIKQALSANLLPNYFFSTPGNDVINGNVGVVNTAVFYSSYANSTVTIAKTGLIVSSTSDGVDTLNNIQALQFSDQTIQRLTLSTPDPASGANTLALDTGPTQNAGSVYMLYQAAFNRTPDASGLGYWINAVDKGSNITTVVAQSFINSAEFIAQYGANPSNASYVNNLYQNVLHRAGDAGGIAYWNQQLNSGAVTKAYVLEQFATLPEGAADVAPAIANGIHYTQWVG
jgi:hypothetical protein